MVERLGVGWIDILIIALAVWRISYMVVMEDGPGWIFAKTRKRMGVQYNEYSQPYGETWYAELFTCVYCMSVWVGFVFSVGLLCITLPTVIISLPFAASAIAMMATSVVYWLNK